MSLRVIWQYMEWSIYCHMTLSAMNYLLYVCMWYRGSLLDLKIIQLYYKILILIDDMFLLVLYGL